MARLTKQERFDRAQSLARLLFSDSFTLTSSVAQFEKWVDAAGKDTMWMFFNEIFPGKFAPGAASKYGYQKRNEHYVYVKRFIGPPKALAMEPLPLPSMVWTGRFKREATSSPGSAPRSKRSMTGWTFSVVIKGPDYIAQNRRVNMLAELRMRHPTDDRKMFQHFERRMSQFMGMQPTRKVA